MRVIRLLIPLEKAISVLRRTLLGYSLIDCTRHGASAICARVRHNAQKC